ncbi:hypothetical protein Tco_1280257 [Tanacetum coccineum]
MLRESNILSLKTIVESIQSIMDSQNARLTSPAESYQSLSLNQRELEANFKTLSWNLGHAPRPTVAPTEIHTPVGGKHAPINLQSPLVDSPGRKLVVYQETPSKNEGESEPMVTESSNLSLLKSLRNPKKLNISPGATIQITKTSGSPFTTPKPDNGKGIANEGDDSPQKLVKASKKPLWKLFNQLWIVRMLILHLLLHLINHSV